MKILVSILFVLIFSLVGLAQENIVPITDGYMLVGGTQNGKWLTDEQVVKNIKKGTKFISVDSLGNNKSKEYYGTIVDYSACGTHFLFFANSAETPLPPLSSFFETSVPPKSIAIGANANWSPVLRNPEKISLTDKKYQRIVAEFLKTKGIGKTKINLKKAYKVDVEGDGIDEVFLEATYYKNEGKDIADFVRAGDYSFILMQKIINGKPQDILIEGEFYPKIPKQIDILSKFELKAIADLNGDGKMEIVLGGFYSYGGGSTDIYELSGNKFTMALSIECGD